MIKCDVPGWDMTQPRQSRYAVIRYGEEWRLLYGAATIGQFPSAEAAMEVADKLCRAVANVGFDVDLTVHTRTGELRSERISNRLKP
jgi:hypothetical protein